MTMAAAAARRTTARNEGPTRSLPRRALLVETEAAVRQLLRTHLELAGFHLEEATDGRVALERLRSVPYDVIILDAVVPNLDGVSLCRAARTGGPNGNAGILMLSGRNTESERVLGLSSGADDYVLKPFGVRELLARIAAILRRAERTVQSASPATPHQAGPLSLDLARRQAYVRGHRVDLTRQEFDVLHQLSARPGMVFSRAALLEHVWSQDSQASLRTVDVAISRLRRKIEFNPHNPQLILTAWGVGYKFTDVR
jgi:DNA-binding response OmpR family regulator